MTADVRLRMSKRDAITMAVQLGEIFRYAKAGTWDLQKSHGVGTFSAATQRTELLLLQIPHLYDDRS